MKNEDNEPKEYFERNILFVGTIAAIGLGLDYLAYYVLRQANPWGALIAVPGIAISLQSLWLSIHPYAIVFEDRFIIKRSLFYNKQFVYLDAKAIEKTNASYFTMIYNDNDKVRLSIVGLRRKHKELFYKKLQEKIGESVSNRSF